MNRAFERIKPGEEAPPPPDELIQWARETAYGSIAGVVYGSYSAHRAEMALKSDPNESMTRRRHRIWSRAISDSTLHGVRLGSFVSVFSATRLTLQATREKRDMWNIVGAGILTSALTGLAIPGTVAVRLRGAALGIVVGGVATLPFGYAMEELERLLPEQFLEASRNKDSVEDEPSKKLDLTGIYIGHVEAELDEYKREETKQRRGWFSRGKN